MWKVSDVIRNECTHMKLKVTPSEDKRKEN